MSAKRKELAKLGAIITAVTTKYPSKRWMFDAIIIDMHNEVSPEEINQEIAKSPAIQSIQEDNGLAMFLLKRGYDDVLGLFKAIPKYMGEAYMALHSILMFETGGGLHIPFYPEAVAPTVSIEKRFSDYGTPDDFKESFVESLVSPFEDEFNKNLAFLINVKSLIDTRQERVSLAECYYWSLDFVNGINKLFIKKGITDYDYRLIMESDNESMNSIIKEFALEDVIHSQYLGNGLNESGKAGLYFIYQRSLTVLQAVKYSDALKGSSTGISTNPLC